MPSFDAPDLHTADRRFARAAMHMPLLALDDEQMLAQAWRERGDEPALHRLVSAYLKLVIAIAARFRRYGLPAGDLIQEGCIGLMQAAARFDPARQVRFSTYATWWIRAAMQEFVLRNWSIVRTGTTSAQKVLFFNLRQLRARLDVDLGGPLGADVRAKIARRLRVPEHEVAMMANRLSAGDRSLNALADADGEREWQDLLPDERPDPEQQVVEFEDGLARARWLHQALADLSPRERKIIAERRLKEEAVTLETLGRSLGISKERVRQLEERALRKLKRAVVRAAGDGLDLPTSAG